MRQLAAYILLFVILISCSDDTKPEEPSDDLQLISISVGSTSLSLTEENEGLPVNQPIVLRFGAPLTMSAASDKIVLSTESGDVLSYGLSFLDNNQTLSLKPLEDLQNNSSYMLEVGELDGAGNKTFPGITVSFNTTAGVLTLQSIKINNQDLNTQSRLQNLSVDFQITATFSNAIDPLSVSDQTVKVLGAGVPTIVRELSSDSLTLTLSSDIDLKHFTKHRLTITDQLTTPQGHVFKGFDKLFYTALDSTFKFPEITDEQLLTKVQEQTFKYFWDFGHPTSGLARERITSGDNVTIGGSGFGVMAILVGIERGFVTREEGVSRLNTIVDFLTNKAQRYHGVWAHWLSGTTGQTNPFSSNDDGADLVESAFMMQGLLTVRQYLDNTDTFESALIDKINVLWNEMEWDWFRQGGQNVLYWHWSPNYGWEKNLKISGWNESLIVYVLAASSTTHSIDKLTYTEGWAKSGTMANGDEFYGVELPLGRDKGGPLFFSHYSFLGLDPRNLSDQYADYFEQNTAHSQINKSYCATNPLGWVGYGDRCWGLTASDGNQGYSAHSPTNDRGVITPTAAISSIPYTPEASMEAIRHFYYLLGDKLWGDYGFVDAFNPTESWYASSYLAIDQGPIICMIENHRTGLLWDLFMSAPEVQAGLDKLGFTY